MKTLKQYLAIGTEKAGSPAALARFVGVSQAAMSRYVTGDRTPDPLVAKRLAHYIKKDAVKVVLAAEVARAPTKEMKKLWEEIAERLAKQKSED